jgi:hypothetical protein
VAAGHLGVGEAQAARRGTPDGEAVGNREDTPGIRPGDRAEPQKTTSLPDGRRSPPSLPAVRA